MRLLIALIVIALVTMLGLAAVALTGRMDVSAMQPHSGLTHWFLETVSDASIRHQARKIDVPPLDDPALLHAGINDYEAMCADCHGAPGRDPAPLAAGLNPPAPDLARERRDPAEIFWVTRNGIRMTGMPAWGASHDDDSLWPVVALVQRLPALDAGDYRDLLAAAGDAGHHGSGDHAHGGDGHHGGSDHHGETGDGGAGHHGEAGDSDHRGAEAAQSGFTHKHDDGSEHHHDE